MGILTNFLKKTPKRSFIYIPEPKNNNFIKITEAIKGRFATSQNRIFKELGEDHPFDFSQLEEMYKKIGLVKAIIDKYVDYIVGPGFFVESENEQAKQIIETFMRDINFDTLLRNWLKEALLKGNGFLEISTKRDIIEDLKILNANWIYIKRKTDKNNPNISTGEIEGYTQFTGAISRIKTNQIISFEPQEIAHLSLNQIGDCAYGIGIIYPMIDIFNNILGAEKDMHMLLKRKANSPLHVKVGNIAEGDEPSPAEIEALGQKLQYLRNNHEFITGDDVEMNTIDFGRLGDKFDFPLNYDIDMLVFASQIPEVLLGRGNIPEGLAKVQLEAFDRNIKSKQQEIEKVIEKDIFKRILLANGLQAHVEFQWGQPSNSELNERLTQYTELLKIPVISPQTSLAIEKSIIKLLNLKVEEEPEQERNKEEVKQKQPKVPGTNTEEHFCSHFQEEDFINTRDYKLQEWLGFNFQEFLVAILNAVNRENFEDLKALSEGQLLLGKFSELQIERLKDTLEKGFKEGQSINTIAENIKKRVKPKDLISEEGKIVLKKENRPLAIARTETTRLAAEGTLDHYFDGGIDEVQFLATISERTCPQCLNLNGKVFKVNEASGIIPIHPMCRCSFLPVVKGI